MKLPLERQLIALFIILLAGILLIDIAVFRNNRSLLAANQWVDHTRQVLYESEQAFSIIKDIETGTRGYIITNDPAFLAPFYTSQNELLKHSYKLQQLTSDNPEQAKVVDSLIVFFKLKIDFSSQSVQALKSGQLQMASNQVASIEGKKYMDEIRRLTAKLQAGENKLLVQRQLATSERIATFNRTFYALVVSMGVLMVFVFFTIRKYMSVRNASIKILNKEISERKAVEKELKNSNLFLDTVLENIPTTIFIKDARVFRFTFINKEGEKTFGKSRTDIIGKNDYELFPKELADFMSIKDHEALETGELVTVSEGLIDTYIGERWMETKIIPVSDEAGHPLYLIIIAVDITTRKREELILKKFNEELEIKVRERTEELAKSEQRFRSLVENATDVIMLLDKEGKLQYASPSVEKITGFSQHELIGSQPFNLLHPDEVQDSQHFFEKVVQEPAVPHPRLHKVLSKEGNYIWMEGVVTNMLQNNNVKSIVANFHDITQLKETAHKLKDYAYELEQSNAELEQFAYIASHDLQEPLRMVSSFLQLLNNKYKDQLDAKAHEYISFAVNGAEQMKQLILDLLAYSRAGTSKENFVRVDLNDILQHVKKTFEQELNDLQGQLIINGTFPVVMAIKMQMTQLLQNLVGNAIKYRGEQPPVIEINCEEKATAWQITVQDNGIGIEPRFFDKIFIIFQRLHNKNKYSGTGIGLAICKKIAERHGGNIRVESTPGKGSKFTFTLKK